MRKLSKSMHLYLYDSLQQRKKILYPINDQVKMYVCGPTLYQNIHVGNARPTIVFDVLFRLLRYLYENVVYVRNITDVDDKIIRQAQLSEVSVSELTENVMQSFQEDMSALNNIPPTFEPKATDHIDDMISMICSLIERGFAYEVDGNVFFDVSKFEDYGQISKINQSEIMSGVRVDVMDIKRNFSDFVLWKPCVDQPKWMSPWSEGRPGWHIECSAMGYKYLGKYFDIHGGGHDLMFPHHENTNAQSRCCHSSNNLANFWMHNGMITIKSGDESDKMSKSKGNVISVKEAIKLYSAPVVRYFFLSSHYRKDVVWSHESLVQSKRSLEKLVSFCDESGAEVVDEVVLKSLMDDLNTPMAIARLHELTKTSSDSEVEYNISRRILCASMKFLGIFNKNDVANADEELMAKVYLMIDERNQAKKRGDYVTADKIRKELIEIGIDLRDGKNGTQVHFVKK
ncbi:cysteine--tRNA ligase [Candidatus Gromoviella agglomerans]|uniref:cysteine--tRNA ligase n=1 Tax=Candidatus Gromoviella agglomerans TaxID=2806609 RepID=UPI001E4C787B|nr:cysteine--tRNA ligase [Candidatus Gromoviella agglomerans]UFX98279.1 Cysteine--tRNA ligase [Candidatus Gromoviella agglomerans]